MAKKKSKRGKVIVTIAFIICLICFLGSGGYLFRYYYISYKAEKNVDGLKQDLMVDDAVSEVAADDESVDGEPTPVVRRKNFEKLLQKNSDIVGWISIEGTSIDYPVMQTPDDNEFYLHRNFEKNYEFSGLPFVDARCDVKKPSENLIIYGHHMNTDTMFTAVHEYKDKKFYEEHPVIQFDSIYEDGDYQICYVILSKAYTEETKDFVYYDFIESKDEEDFQNTVKALKKLSLYDTGEEITMEDQLITLSTCEYSQTNGRMAIIAKKK